MFKSQKHFRHAIQWFGRGTLAIMDQGLISGSNFLLNVLLARWITPEQYGAFTLASSFLILIICVNQALILEPMPVCGPNTDLAGRRRYFGAVLKVQQVFGLVAMLGFAVAAITGTLLRSSPAFTSALAGMIFAAPATLFLYFGRVASYVNFHGRCAASGAFLYTGLLLGSAWALYMWAKLSAFTVLLATAIAAGIVGTFLILRLRPESRPNRHGLRQVWLDHWDFGRWELSKVGFDWLTENIAYAVTAPVLGIAGVGVLKAVLNLYLPLMHMMTALRRLVLPRLAMNSKNGDVEGTRRSVRNLNLLYMAFAAVYALVLCVFSRPILHFAYGDRYSDAAVLLPLASVALAFKIPAEGFDVGLRALRAPKALFFCSAIGAIGSVVVAWPLVHAFGIYGSIATFVFSGAPSYFMLRAAFRRLVRALSTSRGEDLENVRGVETPVLVHSMAED